MPVLFIFESFFLYIIFYLPQLKCANTSNPENAQTVSGLELERHQGSTWDGNRFLRLVSAQLAGVGITAERRSLRVAGSKRRVVPESQGGAPVLACASFIQLFVVGVGFWSTEIQPLDREEVLR